MATQPISVAAEADIIREGLRTIRETHHVPAGFPEAVEAEAASTADRWWTDGVERADRRDIPLVTIDPVGSRDLDQAYTAARRGTGYRIQYAIADVAAFVAPGGAIDVEAWARGTTVYLPDGRVPLHPTVLSEGAASLLPDQERPALLWEIDLDADGATVKTSVARSIVRSRAQLDYAGVQHDLDAGTADDTLVLLREIGQLRQAQEAARGGVSLNLPSQRVERDGDGFRLEIEPVVLSMGWNAQISLLTGMAAAQLMLDGGIGVVRTLPPPSKQTVAAIRRSALALGVAWPAGATYADIIRPLQPTIAAQSALLTQAAHALRGAGYAAFTGGAIPDEHTHAAVAAPYAHVTAPLRRLVDRYAGEVAVALCAGLAVPEPIASRLADLPAAMAEARGREGTLDREVLDLVEAAVLMPLVGTVVRAVVTDRDDRGAQVVLRDPPVVTRAALDGVELGDEVSLKVAAADPIARKVQLVRA